MMILNLAENEIVLNTLTYKEQVLPSTLTHVALMGNNLEWLPPGMFAGSNVKFLGLDGNTLSTVSKANIAALSTSPLQHLNISNNQIFFVEQRAFSVLSELKILELHQNHLAQIPAFTFDSIPKLMHLDLNHNKLKVIGMGAISNLPEFLTLILSSQDPPMDKIEYNAFNNIGAKLKALWVSDNNLAVFPHQVLGYGSYPVLEEMSRTLVKRGAFVPFDTVKALLKLYLGTNTMTHVREKDLCEMTILQELHLEENLLTEATIHPESFRCLTALHLINLNLNKCQYVPEAVTTADRVPSLTSLSLIGNELTFLLKGAFSNVTTLTRLYLSSNAIISIEDGTFPPNLQNLNLDQNQFRFLHENPFTNLSDLTLLNLADNKITVLPDTAFHNLTSLATFDLSNNQIGRLLNTHFKDSPLSNNFYLQNNQIAYIEDGTFNHVVSITNFDLSCNRLTQLPNGGDFQDLTVSKSFSLRDNRLTSVPTGAFRNLQCETFAIQNNKIAVIEPEAFQDITVGHDLDLTSNPLRTLYTHAFQRLTVGRHLLMNGMQLTNLPTQTFQEVSVTETFRLNSNYIKTIEVDAFSWVHTKSLYLGNNTLATLGGKIFGDTSSVTDTLYLDNNRLVQLPSNAFDGATIDTVTLDNNLLVVYPMLNNQNLRKMTMTHNRLGDIPVGTFTVAQATLEELDLRHNHLTTLPNGLLQPLTGLQILRISDNQLASVGKGAFDNLPSLREIYLESNVLTYFPTLSNIPALTTINLGNNTIRTLGYNAFKDSLALSSLTTDVDFFIHRSLEGNRLDCDCYMLYTLNVTQTSIQSGECLTPAAATGVSLSYADIDLPNYFLNVGMETFFCSAANVTARVPGNYKLEVVWDTPTFLYPDGMTIGGANSRVPGMSGPWNYTVTCQSMSSTVTAMVSDETGGLNMTTLTHMFTEADGVEAGTDYSCDITLTAGNQTSGHSPPAFVTTIQVAGRSAIHTSLTISP
ncbi:hypothetical protein LSAT2_008303 [Lamellibrachia satsuma]|nr:hypothetical protein LSAT2_008303 [Lamellibrachia satsuma]